MNSIETILQELHIFLQEKVKEHTQIGVSKLTGCPQSRINDYLKHEEKIQTATLFNILRLFPELQRPILDALASRGGTAIHQEANGNTNSRITQTATVPPSGGAASSEALRDRLIRAVIDLDIPPEIQAMVLKVLKNTP